MTHWAASLVGKPWKRQGRGPDSFDCYGLVRHVLSLHYDITLPDIDTPCTYPSIHCMIQDNSASWVQTDTPEDGAVILMGRKRAVVHVGVIIMVDYGPKCLHSIQPAPQSKGVSGVVLQSLSILREYGWPYFEMYRFYRGK